MRIGAVWESAPNAHYRAIDPLKALARRGHHIVFPRTEEGNPDFKWLRGCDVVHVYRRGNDQTRRILGDLARSGTAITYDNDDDFTAVPKESPFYKTTGGLMGQRIFAQTVKMARMARVFTTTSEILAERYRGQGVTRVEVIENYLDPHVRRPRMGHQGLVIGWVASGEHRADLARINLAEALERIVAKHPHVRVETIGVKLGLSERYHHEKWVPLLELPRRVGAWDIGLAPLSDIQWNRARSDIKVKEYAASGVPWLASPVGPYLGLGEREGGRLIPDDEWFEGIDRLVCADRERRRLARRARRWAKRQTIDAAADRWESVFLEAAESHSAVAV